MDLLMRFYELSVEVHDVAELGLPLVVATLGAVCHPND